jgi:hypothetical protein
MEIYFHFPIHVFVWCLIKNEGKFIFIPLKRYALLDTFNQFTRGRGVGAV